MAEQGIVKQITAQQMPSDQFVVRQDTTRKTSTISESEPVQITTASKLDIQPVRIVLLIENKQGTGDLACFENHNACEEMKLILLSV